jgi:hypothetical protein
VSPFLVCFYFDMDTNIHHKTHLWSFSYCLLLEHYLSSSSTILDNSCNNNTNSYKNKNNFNNNYKQSCITLPELNNKPKHPDFVMKQTL